MRPQMAPYQKQLGDWPTEGRHILAAYDETSIVVYQAYRPEIGEYAAKNGRFGAGFSFTRMSWIKPNFLWMMFRSGWGAKPGQEVVLALELRREFFDGLLRQAVSSTFDAGCHASREEWRADLATSTVRLQWDPDHDPHGTPVPRRAIQLGLRGQALQGWDGTELLSVTDINEFVAEQREFVAEGDLSHLRIPEEQVYPVFDPGIRSRIGLA
jgi:Domain of unknown function (DUF4291)